MFLIGDTERAFYSPDGKAWYARPGIPFYSPTYGSDSAPLLVSFKNNWLTRIPYGVAFGGEDASSWQTVLTLEDPYVYHAGLIVTPNAVYAYADTLAGRVWYESFDGLEWENLGTRDDDYQFQFCIDGWWFWVDPADFVGGFTRIAITGNPVVPSTDRYTPIHDVYWLKSTGKRAFTTGSWGALYQERQYSSTWRVTDDWPVDGAIVENGEVVVGRVIGDPGLLLRAPVDNHFNSTFPTWEPVVGPPPNNVELFGNHIIVPDTDALWLTLDGVNWQKNPTPPGYFGLFAGAARTGPIYFLRSLDGHLISTIDGKNWRPVGNIPPGVFIFESAWNGVNPDHGGQWAIRQRQSLAGSSGWPVRQRQNGGLTGSWPVRQRQRGL